MASRACSVSTRTWPCRSRSCSSGRSTRSASRCRRDANAGASAIGSSTATPWLTSPLSSSAWLGPDASGEDSVRDQLLEMPVVPPVELQRLGPAEVELNVELDRESDAAEDLYGGGRDV